MERLVTLTSLVLIVVVGVRSFETVESTLKGNDIFKCVHKLVCELNKFEEILEIRKTTGPEVTGKSIEFIAHILDIKVFDDTPEFFGKCQNLFCSNPKEEAENQFNDFCTANAERTMDVCQDQEVEICKRMEAGLDHFSIILGKYEALGVCKAETVFREIIA